MHTGGQGDLLRFSGRAQTLVEGLDDRIVAHGNQRGHRQDGVDARPAAPDDMPAAQRPALTGERRDPDQRGDGRAVETSASGPLGEQGQGRGGANAGDAAQQALLLPLEWVGVDGVTQVTVPVVPILFQPHEVARDVRSHRRQLGVEPLALRGAHGDKVAPVREQRAEFLSLRVGQRARHRLDHLDEAREHLGNEGSGLGQLPDRAGKVAHLARADHGHREACGRQRGGYWQFAPSGRLQHDQGRPQGPQARHHEPADPTASRGATHCSALGRTVLSNLALTTSIPMYTAVSMVQPSRSPCGPSLSMRDAAPQQLCSLSGGMDAATSALSRPPNLRRIGLPRP